MITLNVNPLIKRPWVLASLFVSFICIILMMITFRYTDGLPYLSWSVDLWDCIFHKTDLEFYEYTILNPRSPECLNYACDRTILALIPLSIWNLPIWIAHEITGNVVVTGFWDYVWLKIGLLLCVGVTSVEASKIVKLIKPDADRILVFPLIFASFDVLCSTMYASQDEIIYLMTLIMGMRFLLQKRTVSFLICSTIAVSLNPEMIIPVLLMILFSEKRILFVLLDLMISLIPTFIFNFAYKDNVPYNTVNVMQGDLIKNLFSSGISLSQDIGNVSLFLLLVMVLMFFTYTKQKSEPFDLIFTMAMTMTGMTLLSSGGYIDYFYRSILYVPYMVIMILVSGQNLKTNLLLYGLYSWARGWLCVISNHPQNMSSMYIFQDNEFTQRVYNKAGILVMGRFYGDKFPILNNFGLFTAICLAAAVILFVINSKGRQNTEYKTIKVNTDIAAFVSGMFVVLVLFAFGLMFIKAPKLYSRTIRFGTDYIDANEENCVRFYYDNNGIKFYNTEIIYNDNVCLMNGYDDNGARYLYRDGVSFGPYMTLYPGKYQITVMGQNLYGAQVDCAYNLEGMPYLIPINITEAYGDSIIYTFEVEGEPRTVELREYNPTEETMIIDSIIIQEY